MRWMLVKLPATEGLLVVEAEPDGLEVIVDGLPAGMAPVLYFPHII